MALSRETAAARARIEFLHKASNELVLLLTKITWLQLETKSEFGSVRAQKAQALITEDLNKIVIVVIPDPAQRDVWIKNLSDSLARP